MARLAWPSSFSFTFLFSHPSSSIFLGKEMIKLLQRIFKIHPTGEDCSSSSAQCRGLSTVRELNAQSLANKWSVENIILFFFALFTFPASRDILNGAFRTFFFKKGQFSLPKNYDLIPICWCLQVFQLPCWLPAILSQSFVFFYINRRQARVILNMLQVQIFIMLDR